MSVALSRRNFIRSAALAGVALPFLRILGMDPCSPRIAHAGPTKPPSRVLFVYIPDGLAYWDLEIGKRGTSDTDFSLGEFLTPLDTPTLKPHVNIYDGIDMFEKQVADTHTQGTVMYLCNQGFAKDCGGSTKNCAGNGKDSGGTNGMSVDQYLANQVGKKVTPLMPSMQVGVQQANYPISYTGPGFGTGMPFINDPAVLYSKFFGNFSSSGTGPDPALVLRNKLRQSVLDNVRGELSGLNARLGMEDRGKLQQHLTAIRQMELQLAAPPSMLTCTKPGAPTLANTNLDDSHNYPALASLQGQMITNAFACDLTRIATLQFRACYSGQTLPFDPVQVDSDIHALSHACFDAKDSSGAGAGTDPNSGHARFVRAKRWHYQQVADIASALDKIQESDGSTALDNTFILIGSDIGAGHTHQRMPFVSIGGRNLGAKTGRYLQYPGSGGSSPTYHARLLISALQMMGLGDTTFGASETGSGALSNMGGLVILAPERPRGSLTARRGYSANRTMLPRASYGRAALAL